jgi:hypothetical protein
MTAPRPFLMSAAVLLLAASCQTTDTPPEELLVGEGVLQVTEPEAGAELCQAPVWGTDGIPPLGSELIFHRGGDVAHFRVELSPYDGWQMTDVQTGVSQIFGADWSDMGKDLPQNAGPIQRLLPGDPVLHFPLWTGKTWSARFYSHGMRREPIQLQTSYHCDQREKIETPAGELNCYRIWRRVELAEGGSEARVSLYWYAPEVGFIVKRLDDSKLLELYQISKPSN